jgi:predicted nucleotidyltransferase
MELAERIAERLADVEGVEAVVLGGSWARGEAHPDSDVDLGIYYRPERRPSLAALRELARELDDRHVPDLVTDFGEWGPWIDGGGWLRIEGRRVDWLYRDLDLVSREISECHVGRTSSHYQPGHPHGFHTHIYAGEVHHCRVLRDVRGKLASLKALVADYPAALKRSLTRGFCGRQTSRWRPAASPQHGATSSTSPVACSGARPAWSRCCSPSTSVIS